MGRNGNEHWVSACTKNFSNLAVGRYLQGVISRDNTLYYKMIVWGTEQF